MRLLLIHGIAQEKFNGQQLIKIWKEALSAGCATANVKEQEYDIALPYFGKRLAALTSRHQFRSTATRQFESDVVQEIAEQNNSDLLLGPINPRKSAFPSPPAGHRIRRGGAAGPLVPKPVRDLVRYLDATWPDLTTWTLRRFLRVVYVYLHSAVVRKAIDDIVIRSINQNPTQPTLLVGHSLGSVIAFNVMKKRPDVPWQGFMTIGSPLGIKAIADQIPESDRALPVLKAKWAGYDNDWINVFDRRDIVALKPLGPPSWLPDKAITNLNHVKNTDNICHGITGYLRDPKIATAINTALAG